MSNELIAKLGDLITDVVAVRSCTAPDKTLWTKAQVMHYLQIGETRLKELAREGFPGPRIRVCVGPKGDRWIAKDVQDWAVNRQFQAGRPRNAA